MICPCCKYENMRSLTYYGVAAEGVYWCQRCGCLKNQEGWQPTWWGDRSAAEQVLESLDRSRRGGLDVSNFESPGWEWQDLPEVK